MSPSVSTNKSTYVRGESVTISGVDLPSGNSVSIQVKSNTGKIIWVDQQRIGSQGHFTSIFKLNNNVEIGQYQVNVSSTGLSISCSFIVTIPASEVLVKRESDDRHTDEETVLVSHGLQVSLDPKTVIVSYGRNEEARIAMFNFLRALGLNPVEWPEAIAWTGEGSPYSGIAVENLFRRAPAVIILMTPDDEARLYPYLCKEDDPDYEKDYTPQPRQNVIFEAGMALAIHPDKTILVELGKRRPFTNIEGRNVIRLNNTSQKREELVQRLVDVGCQVRRKGTDYLSTKVADFDAAITNVLKDDKTERVQIAKGRLEEKVVLTKTYGAGVEPRLSPPMERNAYLILTVLKAKPQTVALGITQPRTEPTTGDELAKATNLSPPDIDRVVKFVRDKGWVEYVGTYSVEPYSFGSVRITQNGRSELERMIAVKLDDAKLMVLYILYNKPRDSNGLQRATGEEIQKATNLKPHDINDALNLLEGDDFVKVAWQHGPSQFHFGEAFLKPKGRLKCEESLDYIKDMFNRKKGESV